MSPLESEGAMSADFTAAAAHASSARAGMAMNHRLLLYGLYKQAHRGDAPTTPPAWIHVVDWSKHAAWDRYRGMTKEEAQRRYVQLVDELLPEWRRPGTADTDSPASAKRLEAPDANLDADALAAKVAALEERLARLTRREKRGWLFRYTPQGGSWLQPFGGSSRWERRFFVLQPKVQGELQARLTCFRGEFDDLQPRRAIPLTNVVVVDEGPKRTRDRTYYVFSLYILGTLGAERGPGSGALIRLSSASSAEALQWISCLDEASGSRGVRRLRSEADAAAMDISADREKAGGASAEDDGVARVLQTLGSSVNRLGSWLSAEGLRRRGGDPNAAPAKERRSEKAEKQERKSKSGRRRVDPRLFPASRPMHRQRQTSLLSSAGKLGSEVELYGLINLSLIVLFTTHMHLLLDNYLKFGFQFRVSELPTGSIGRAICSLLLCCVPMIFCLLAAYAIEVSAIRRPAPQQYLSGDRADVLHGLNVAASILVPCALVCGGWCTSSAGGVVLLLLASILFMKLVSWAHVHRDLRLASLESESCLEAEYHGARTSAEQRSELELAKFAADVQHTEGHAHYPHNVTLINLCYFTLAPTLCYQEAFPKSERIRTAYLVSLLGRFLLLCAFIGFACWQLILPVLRTSVSTHGLCSKPPADHGRRTEASSWLQEPFCGQNPAAMLERLLKLALPVTYVWLAAFYAFFHVWLNAVAEVLRFGDRQFYQAWWNAVTFEQYWRLWNMPVHNWISRHVYFPCLRLNLSKATCGLIAFTISAIFHELIIALPLRSLHMPLAFIAMMAQVPLVSLSAWINLKTRGTMFEQLGNYLFWISFCFFGQPLAVLLYYNMLVLAEAPAFCQDAGNIEAVIAPAAYDRLLESPAVLPHHLNLPSWLLWKR